MLRLASVFCVLMFGFSCLVTNEFGVQPVNSIRAEEIPSAVGLRTANGWLTALGFFESDKKKSVVRESFKENLYFSAYGAGAFSIDGKVSDGEFFTRESFDNCLEQAFTGAAGGALIRFYGVQFGFATNSSAEINELDMLSSAWFAGAAGATECRTALIRTGRVFEIGVLRF